MKAASEIGQVLQETDKIKQGIDDLLKYVYEPSIGVSFDLPKDTFLVKTAAKDIKTLEDTVINIEINVSSLMIDFKPYLYIDVVFPLNNLKLRAIRYFFSTQSVEVDTIYDSLLKLGGVNAISMQTATLSIQTIVYKLLKDTRIQSTMIYSPLKDPRPLETINLIISNAIKLADEM